MSSENQQVLRLRQTYLMRRFLLLALGMGFLLPTAANAETWWLIMKGRQEHSQDNVFSAQMPTASKVECEKARDQAIEKDNWKGHEPWGLSAICLKGK